MPRKQKNGRQWDQIGILDCFNNIMSAKAYLLQFLTKILKKNLESKLLQLLVGEGVRGAYRKPLLRISRYSASEMDIFTEMDIFRKCKVFSGVKYKKFLGVFHLLPKDLEREYFDRCAGFCSGNWGVRRVFRVLFRYVLGVLGLG